MVYSYQTNMSFTNLSDNLRKWLVGKLDSQVPLLNSQIIDLTNSITEQHPQDVA